jgi:peroxiredoxin Q/BCP
MRVLLTMGLVATLAAGAMAQSAVELKVGDMAPDFTLQGTDGKTHKLSDYRGKQAVVIAWFPRAFTQGCTIECKSLAENGDKIKQYEVSYFMISTDNVDDQTKFANAASVTLGQGEKQQVVEKKAADFPMLADPTKQTATAYGVLRDFGGSFGVMAQRWTFYIGKDGKILAIDKEVKPATSAEDMAAKLGTLKVAMK